MIKIVVKVKESFEETRHVKNNDKSKKTFYEDIEMQDTMKKYYQLRRNLEICNFLSINFSKMVLYTELKFSA